MHTFSEQPRATAERAIFDCNKGPKDVHEYFGGDAWQVLWKCRHRPCGEQRRMDIERFLLKRYDINELLRLQRTTKLEQFAHKNSLASRGPRQ